MENNLLTIIMPVYNEEESLRGFLPQVIDFCKEHSYRLIVVNDGSKDGTTALLKEHGGPEMEVISHKLNRGYGAAIKSGIGAARTKYVITIDGDGQHSLTDVQRLLEEIVAKDADMVVGSRTDLPTGSLYRKIGKAIIRGLARIMLPIHIRDINSGIKIYDTELAKKNISLCPETMAFSDIIAMIFISRRYLVLECPVSIRERTTGRSTISTMTAVDTVREILNIILLFSPMKVFLPVSLFCILAGLSWGIPIMLRGRGLSVGALLALATGLIVFFFGLIAEQISFVRKARIYEQE